MPGGGVPLLGTVEQDVRNGGIFVPTQQPAAIDERVTVEIHIPPPVDRVMPFSGKVVQVAEGSADSPNLLAGVGVEFTDPERVLQQLQTVIYSE